MSDPDPPTRAQLSTKLAELAHTLDWADMRSGNEPTCIELSQAIIDTANDYQSAVRHFLRERDSMDDFEDIVATLDLELSRAAYADAIVELALVLQRAENAGSNWAGHLANQLEFAVQRYKELGHGG